MGSSNPLQNQLLLYQQYFGSQGFWTLQRFEESHDHERYFHEIRLRGIDALNVIARKRLDDMAVVHKVMAEFCSIHPEVFRGKEVLEIGSGEHLEQRLIVLSRSYTGVDLDYPMSIDNKALVDRTDAMIRKSLGRREDKRISRKGTSRTGLYETSTESGKIVLAGGFFEDIRTKSQFDVVLNNSIVLEDDKDIEQIKRLLRPDGRYVCLDRPDLMIKGKLFEPDHFELLAEHWFEVKGPALFKDELIAVNIYRSI